MAKGQYTKILAINDKWRLKSDSCNWIPQQLIKTEKKPDGVWTDLNYHPTIERALNAICKEEIKLNGTLQDVINKIDELQELIKSLNFDEKVEK